MRSSRLPWLLLGLAVLASCAGESGAIRPSAPRGIARDQRLFPLDEGVVRTFEKRPGGARVSVRTVAEAGGGWTRFLVVGKRDATFARMRWRGRDLVIAMPEREDAVLLRLPGKPGASWDAAPGVRATVKRDETLTTSAGSFPCVVIELARGPAAREVYWLAPGVGFVRVMREAGARREEAVLVGTPQRTR